MASFHERSVHFPLKPRGETSPVDSKLVRTEAQYGWRSKGCHIPTSSAHGGGDLRKPALFWELCCYIKALFELICSAFPLNLMILFTLPIPRAFLYIEGWKIEIPTDLHHQSYLIIAKGVCCPRKLAFLSTIFNIDAALSLFKIQFL